MNLLKKKSVNVKMWKCENMKTCLSPFCNENVSLKLKIESKIKQRMVGPW